MRKRILSIWLSVCMVLTLLPISAMAEEAGTPIGVSEEIIAFAPLDETEMSVPIGTSVEDLELPESLTATVRAAVVANSGTIEEAVQDSGNPDNLTEATPGSATPTDSGEQVKANEVTEPEWSVTTSDIPITWTAEPEYNRNENGNYVFTPVIEGYTVSAGLPEITVTVGAQPLMTALRTGTPATYGDFSVSIGDGAAPTFDESNNTLTFSTAGEYTVGMAAGKTSTTDRIGVTSAANITLAGVNIDVSSTENAAALKITSTAGAVNITLADGSVNTLKSGNYCAGLQKDTTAAGTMLTITGTGTLNATGGWYGAGIGGTTTAADAGGGTDGSYITISGGTVTATGGTHGAGIGGGGNSSSLTGTYSGGSGSYITISGGTVTANGGYWSAGIGGGSGGTWRPGGNGNHITISGGTVTATGGSAAAGIGAGTGKWGGVTDNIIISGGSIQTNSIWCTPTNGQASPANVYKTTLPVPSDTTGGTDVSTMTFTSSGTAYTYNMTDAKSILDSGAGKVFVYLPGDDTGIAATASYAGKNYAATVKNDNNAVFALPQAQWGIAGSDGTEPTEWTQGTLADAISYANGFYGGTVYIQLLTNIDKDSHSTWPLTFKNWVTPTILDLNGKDIDRGLSAATPDGNVITADCTMTIKDSSTDEVSKQGHITGGYNSGDTGGGVYAFGVVTMQGGNITGNKSTSSTQGGGGVMVGSMKTFIMQGGSITNNEAANQGGAVYAPQGSFTMTGGSITGNKSPNGGINAPAFKVGGTALIKDNTVTGSSAACNVVLTWQAINFVDGAPLTSGASIGVTANSAPTSGNPVNVTFASSSDCSAYFFSDSSDYAIQNSGSGTMQRVQLALTPPVVIGTLSILDSFTAGHNLALSELTAPTVTTKTGILITAKGWQSCVNSGSWTNWSDGVLPLDTSAEYKLRYYATYSDGTVYSNEVPLTVVGNTTTLALAASPESPQIMGSSVTLTATLTGYFTGPGVNGQAITFKNGGTDLGTANLNTGGVAVFTWTPGGTGTFALTAEYAATSYNTATTSSAVNYTVIVDPDTAIVAAAKTAAQDASYADMTQTAATDEDAIKAALKNTAETAVNNSEITITIDKDSYTPPITGTSANPSGTNGSYTFTVTVSKGSQSDTTVQKTIVITATPYTGVTDAQAVSAAKTALVDGTVNVAFGASQTDKTAAVQAYVNGLLSGNAAGVTATVTYNSGTGKYDVALSKGSVNDSKSLSMTVNIAPDPDIAIVAAAKTAAQNASYADMSQAAAADEAAIKAALKNTAETAVNNSNITVTINKVGYIAPIAGTSANPSGTNGSYTFTSTVSKGSQSEPTVQKTITITATPYTGGTGGGGGNGGGSGSGSNTPAPSTKPTEPVTGSTQNKATVDGKGNANVSLTDKNITDAIADAKAEAAKKGVNAGDITAVIHVTTGGKDANAVTVNLPKTTQEQVIDNKISSVQLVIDRPDLTIGINLAAVTEINRQAKADVQLSATRMDNAKLSGDVKAAIGSRPAFDLKATYGSGKSVTDFGKGSVSVEIPYTLQKGEIAGNVYAVYVDAKGKVTYLTDSSYDARRGTVVFSTSHFSTYGIAYKASFKFTDINGHWAKDDILFVVNRGLMTGTSATTFSPNGSMTRGMFVTALGRLADADVSGYTKSSFTDVKANAYYMGYIEWGVKNNILVGIGGKFDPDGLVTREQMAVIMDRYATAIGFKLPEVHAQNTFADNAKIGAWAAPSVKRIQMAGIIQGKSNNLYDPQGTATRAEVSAVLRHFVELEIFNDTAQGWSMNDSGQWMYYENGKPIIGKKDIGGTTYTFDQYGVTADVPKDRAYSTYTVQRGDSFWTIARKFNCTMAELERLNNKGRFSLIYPGDVLRVPEQK